MLKKPYAWILAILLMLPGVGQAREQLGIVTFTVDNITAEFFKQSMPVFFDHGVPGSMYGQTEPIGLPGEIGWAEIRYLIERGWEFGAHGHSHDKMTEMDDARLELELGAPAAQIFRGTTVYPTSFATPHGAYDERVIERAKVYYDAHLTGWGNEGVNYFESTDHFRINREQIDNRRPADEVCADIEKAGREGYWLVLMLHRIGEDPSDAYENPTEQFEAVVKCAADLRDRGNVRLTTVRDALRLVPHTPAPVPEGDHQIAVTAKNGSSKGLVSITFDDATRPQYDFGLRIAQGYGLPGTLFIPSGLLRDRIDTPQGDWRLTWEEVREFYESGWEIGAHGHTHIRLPGLPPEEFEAELNAPIEEIEAKVGTRPVSFASPFGDFTEEIIASIMTRYDYHLSWKGNLGRNPINDIDPRYVGRLEVTNDMTAATVCGEMLRAAQNGVWLVFLFHGITEEAPREYEIEASVYDEIMGCAARLDRAEIIDVVTVKDAMATIAAE